MNEHPAVNRIRASSGGTRKGPNITPKRPQVPTPMPVEIAPTEDVVETQDALDTSGSDRSEEGDGESTPAGTGRRMGGVVSKKPSK